jgi:hypothetical protein
MAKRRPVESQEEEMLRLARERIDLPQCEVRLKYQSDADILLVELKENPKPTHSEDDMEHGLIYNYEGSKLVSIELLDLYGVFVS